MLRLPFPLFLALRYLRPKRSVVSVVSVISVIGVMVGVAALIVVISVMNGFGSMWEEKILGFNAHSVVSLPPEMDDWEAVAERLETVDGVVAVAPFVQGLGVVQHRGRTYAPQIRGIDLQREEDLLGLSRFIVQGSMEVADGEVLIGSELQLQVAAQVGDLLTVMAPQAMRSVDELPLPDELEVRGVFNVGMIDFDRDFLLTTLYTARDLLGMEGGVHGLQIMVEDPLAVDRMNDALEEAAGFPVYSWKQLNAQLFSVLAVEKSMMFFLLVLISVVAAFAIMNTVITVTYLKTREIGILKALGYGDHRVAAVFTWYGAIQGMIGNLFGLAAGLLLLRYRDGILETLSRTFGVELFPKDFYWFDTLPARIEWDEVAGICLLTLVICALAGWLPALRAAALDPVKALRND